MRKLAVVNQKGGVGKTTIALNLAGALSERGLRTLVVDVDPQGYATAGAGVGERYDAEGPNLAHVLLGELAPGTTAADLVVPTAEGFHVLPSHLDLFLAEPRLYAARGREHRLADALDPVAGEWDAILIDCPASLGVLTDNAIVAAGEVLVPMIPDGLSIRALELLLDQMDSIRQGLRVDVQVAGLVLNQVDETRACKRVEEDLSHVPLPIVARCRRRTAVKEAWESGRTVISQEPSGHIAIAMRELAEALFAPAVA